eukprot:2564548-Rhodomonas_salina.7
MSPGGAQHRPKHMGACSDDLHDRNSEALVVPGLVLSKSVCSVASDGGCLGNLMDQPKSARGQWSINYKPPVQAPLPKPLSRGQQAPPSDSHALARFKSTRSTWHSTGVYDEHISQAPGFAREHASFAASSIALFSASIGDKGPVSSSSCSCFFAFSTGFAFSLSAIAICGMLTAPLAVTASALPCFTAAWSTVNWIASAAGRVRR